MEEFIRFLQTEIEEPKFFSLFHLIALAIIIPIAILVPYLFRNTNEKTYKRILFINWSILLILEVFKQLVKAYHYGNPSYWEYSYRDFPFSVCSMIYYFTPIILFVNKEKHPKIVDTAIGYMAFILVMAGAAVCIYPNVAVSRFIYIDIQTFIHHGSQVVLGILVFVWNRKSITIKTFYRSMIAFAITVVIAIVINLSFYPHYVNMFFITPLFITNMPIGNIIQEKAGYPVYLITFLLVVSLASFLTFLLETSIYKLVEKRKEKRMAMIS